MAQHDERTAILEQLQALDPNGAWTDAHCIADGDEPLTLQEARNALYLFHAQDEV